MTSRSISTSRSDGERRFGQLTFIGDAGGLVVDPVRADIVRAVAGGQRLAQARLPAACASRRIVDGGLDRLVLETVVEVVRERSGKDVGVLRRIGDAPAGNRLMHVGEVDAADDDASAARKGQARDEVRDVVLAAVSAADQRHVLAGADGRRKRDRRG